VKSTGHRLARASDWVVRPRLDLHWNLLNKTLEQFGYIRECGGRFVIPIPRVEVVE
jgi:hypothetical protein